MNAVHLITRGRSQGFDRSRLLGDRCPEITPSSAHDECWVSNRHRKACNGNHGALQNHQKDFIIGQITIKSTLQLSNTEARPNENRQNGGDKTFG